MGTPEAGEVAGPWYSCQVSRAQGCRGEIADVWGSCGRLHAGGSGVATRTTTVDAEDCACGPSDRLAARTRPRHQEGDGRPGLVGGARGQELRGVWLLCGHESNPRVDLWVSPGVEPRNRMSLRSGRR